MTRRYYTACRECWDPVEKEGDELCWYHRMTPEQRARNARRNVVLIAVVLCVWLGAALWPWWLPLVVTR